jgi:hypothetical protein
MKNSAAFISAKSMILTRANANKISIEDVQLVKKILKSAGSGSSEIRLRRTRICLNAQFHLKKLVLTIKSVFVIRMNIVSVQLTLQFS